MPTQTLSPTAFEQLQLELINRARANPAGEYDAIVAGEGAGHDPAVTSAIVYFGVDTNAFATQMAGLAPVAPVAWNMTLADAALGHTEAMIEQDVQSHQVPGEASLGQRVRDAGYTGFSRVTENVYAYAESGEHAHAGFVLDWGYDDEDFSNGTLRSDWQTLGDGIQDPAGHRDNILDDRVTEVGIAAVEETNSSTDVGPWVITQNFGSRFESVPQLLGVVIDDADEDRFYDMGEGLGAVYITAYGAFGSYETVSWDAGGFQMALPEGRYFVTMTGGGLSGSLVREVTIGAENVKLDGIAAEATPGEYLAGTSADDTLAAIDTIDFQIRGLGGKDSFVGGTGNDFFIGDDLQVGQQIDISGQVFRLYQAALDRAPDTAGHLNWFTRILDGEISLTSVAAGFVDSLEFNNVYGALSNQDFVELMYQNVLDRVADSGGLASWVGKLDQGQSRAEVLVGFSESPEFKTNTSAASTAFAEARTEAAWADDVFRLYQATLDRNPDASGFVNWMGALGNGASYLGVAAGFVNSAEFRSRYDGLDDQGFVELLYQNVLGRAADAGGLAWWTGNLSSGMTRAEVVRGFAQSGEYVDGTADDVVAFVRGLGIDDTFHAGGGTQNRMMGGALSDAFVFTAGSSSGTHTIHDFEDWDVLRFSGYGDDAAAIASQFQVSGPRSLTYSDGDLTIVLQGTDLPVLDAGAIEMI